MSFQPTGFAFQGSAQFAFQTAAYVPPVVTGGGVDLELYRRGFWPQPSSDSAWVAVPKKARRVIESVAREVAREAPAEDAALALDEGLRRAGVQMDAAHVRLLAALRLRDLATLAELRRALEREQQEAARIARQHALQRDEDDAVAMLLLMH